MQLCRRSLSLVRCYNEQWMGKLRQVENRSLPIIASDQFSILYRQKTFQHCRMLSSSNNNRGDDAPDMKGVVDRWGWLLRLIGYYGDESVRARQALAMFSDCEDQATTSGYFEHLSLPDTFYNRHQLITLHIWIVHKRLLLEGTSGRHLQEAMFDVFWENTQRRIRASGVHELTVNKHLRDVQRVTFGSCIQYDYGLKQENDKNLELSSAIWRSLFSSNQNAPQALVYDMAQYVRKEIARMEKEVTIDQLHSADFGWTLPNKMKRLDDVLDPNDDVWKQALDITGREYWWNVRTRESRWQRPSQIRIEN